MRDGPGSERGSRRESCERQELADLASQTMGIPRRQALRLADRYLAVPRGETSFLVWLAQPRLPRSLSRPLP
jgi:hypothetical protein